MILLLQLKLYLNILYAKIQDSDRVAVLDIEKKIGRTLPHGVYIDIFPFDGTA